MEIFRYNSAMKILEQKGQLGLSLMRLHDVELVDLKIDSGVEISEHSLPFSVIFYVVGGSGVLTIGSQGVELGKGDSALVNACENRIWKNSGREELHLLVVKRMDKE